MLKILIAEDDKNVVEIITAHLRGFFDKFPEFQISRAETLEEAERIILETPAPDIVLLDLRLKDADVDATIAKIQAFEDRAPVLVITGMGTIFREIKDRVMKAGASGYIAKDTMTGKSLLDGIISAISRTTNPRRRRSEALTAKMEKLLPPAPNATQ